MAIENYMNFGVIISFFVGSFFSFLKFHSVFNIILGTFIISGVVFLIISVCSTLVLKYIETAYVEYIEKDVYETVLEDFKIKINDKHTACTSIIDEIDSINMEDFLKKNATVEEDPLNNESTNNV